MKFINLLLCLLLILLLIFGCQGKEIPQPVSSSAEPAVEQRYPGDQSGCSGTDCDLAIATEKARLQLLANQECRTSISCISCCTGELLTYAKIKAEPNCPERQAAALSNQ